MISSTLLNNIENLKSKNIIKGLSLYVVLVVVVLLCFAILPYIHLNITSQNPAFIRSALKKTTIQIGTTGKLKRLSIKNNNTYIAGDTLAIVSQDLLESSQVLNDSLYNFNQDYLLDITQLLNKQFKNLRTTTAQKEYNTYKARSAGLYSTYSFAKKQHDRQKVLFEKEVIALSVYEQYVFELEKAQSARTAYKAQQIASWELKKRELEERLQNLANARENIAIQARDYVITAPISGTIENYQGVTVGSQVSQGQVIAVISPNDNLIVESTVKPSDIGLIKIGQSVRYQFDAFNYNQWGFLDGEVIDIDKNITLSETGAYFKVRCSLPNKTLTLKNGYEAEISKGMTLTARYFITRRSLWDLLFDKVDDWFNPKLITTTA
ncbi:HlyD family secretion protein [Dokdonia donghaensis]|uniref:AprE-like beta-barrel domain-containing protein n=1 Tax=Dokdonia donghaensis DSW-1 TaxID=1300343 RepID=A0A0A2GWL0_9FLAO|nr:HlyD family efflux transporter periplasmic adaptor subunit [Dokdonia donghaensis]ANH59513.1 Hemolysin secretion protein D, chromosomal [Dokdonia donghaensis DSW-1]KGO06893.1 hypothetical protein NV36_08560 [Dokdonia donghaensis DSW-1]